MTPGLLVDYNVYGGNRDYWDTNYLRVISCIASENIPAGVLVQAVGDKVRIARDTTAIVGVSLYDPSLHSPQVVYTNGDSLPVLRYGACYARFMGTTTPLPMRPATAILGPALGVFSEDEGAVIVPRMVFSVNAKERYPTPYDLLITGGNIPIPPGVSDVLVTPDCCIVELG